MEVCVFDVHQLKHYNVHCGCDDDKVCGLGSMLYQAQKECFLTEGMGIQISTEYCDMFLEGKQYVKAIGDSDVSEREFNYDSSEDEGDLLDDEVIYPILGPNTAK